MSTATVRLSDRTTLTFDTIEGIFAHSRTGPGVLLAIGGRTQDLIQNVAFIPVEKIGTVIASLQLMQKQLQGQGATCHMPDVCKAGQVACPTPQACRVAP